MPDNEVQRNTQKYIFLNLVKLLKEITGKDAIVLKESAVARAPDQSNSTPQVSFVLKTLNLTSEDIIYQSVVAQYPLTNPFIEPGSSIEIKPTDYDSTPTLADSTSIAFKIDHVQVAQSVSDGDYNHKSSEQLLPIDSGEARIRILLIVYEIVNYLKDLEKNDPLVASYTSEPLNRLADVLVDIVYEQLDIQNRQDTQKIEGNITSTNYLGETLPYIAISRNKIDISDDDVTITFARIDQLLHLRDEDSAHYDAALQRFFSTGKNDDLKKVFEGLAGRIFDEHLEGIAVQFSDDASKSLKHTWGESATFNIQKLTKHWLFRSVNREKPSIADDGSVKEAKSTVSTAYSSGASLKSIFFILGLLGFISPQQGLKAYE